MKRERIFGLTLACVMLVGLLSGCTGNPAASPTPGAGGGDDVIFQLAGVARDAVVCTADGDPVTAEEYFFWISQAISNLSGYSATGTQAIDWTAQYEGVSTADYLKSDALETSKLYHCITALAKEAGYSSSDADRAEYDKQLAGMAESLGGEELLALWLRGSALTEEGLWTITGAEILFNRYIEEQYYAADAPGAPTEEQMRAYIEENDVLMAKHILLLTVDTSAARDPETGKYPALAADVVAQKKAQADGFLSDILADSNPAALFDTLMNENSEDTGLYQYPSGYRFSAGEMVPEFEAATRGLEFGAVSGVVESDFGYHIILRLNPDTPVLREEWINTQVDAMIGDKIEKMDVKTTEIYDKLDIEAFYTALTALQEETDAQMTALREAAATPAPTGAPTPVPTP